MSENKKKKNYAFNKYNFHKIIYISYLIQYKNKQTTLNRLITLEGNKCFQ